MLRNILTAAFVAALIVVQTTVLHAAAVFHVIPNLLLVTAVCYGLLKEGWAPLILGAACGLLLDFTGGRMVGVNTLLCTWAAFGCMMARPSLFEANAPVAALFVLGASLLYGLFFYLFNFALWGAVGFGYAFLHKILPETIYNAAVSFLIYPVARALAGKSRPKPGSGL